jgi:serine/threonine protein kinase
MTDFVLVENQSVESLIAQVADEFVQRLGRGEHPDVEEYAQCHPTIATILRQVLPALTVLRSEGASPLASSESGEAGVRLTGSIGDYRIVREVGRGGMGVVYEAEQISLGRRVALKVLPFAAALDARHLQRFKNEAQAAALLQHPNIVSIYGVGCERGVHFYAMQFIDGQTLAEVIRDLRQGPPTLSEGSPAAPTRPGANFFTDRSARAPEFFRTVARLGLQAAEALEHAHQQGVIHRDVKPANLLMDATGHLWIADFGLARCRTEPGLTGTGDVVGTLRYMSPEQALGKRGVVDHRTDLYSLGATLYEALTLQPAYSGRDSQELLQQIAHQDPRPPRRLNPAVPAALETIVLKAMAREPQARYTSAQEMADDLRRFLEGLPILASRPTWRERAARWAVRHRQAVAVAVVVMILALAGLSAASVVFYRQRQEIAEALIQVRAQEAQARAQRQRTEANFQKALQGATHILMQLDPKPGAPPLDGERLREALIEQGLRFYQKFIDEASDDPAVRFESAQAYKEIARMYCAEHKIDQCQKMMDKSIALLDDLVDAHPQELTYLKTRVGTCYLKGLMCKSAGRPDQARQAYARVVELCHHRLPFDEEGKLPNYCAWILVDCPEPSLRDPAHALELAQQAVAAQPGEAGYWNTLGVARYRLGDWAAAVTALEKSMKLQEGGDPNDWFFLAMAHARLGDRAPAHDWFARATAVLDKQPYPPEDWMRYRDEAAALLGEPPPKK